ncbi:hypothetical protein B0T24DRAFT_600388 [Lasiosphaeria ovina]|uniref:Methyltransferase domain-containing protein n=1 Tax=Lasiosphaeria ovina TaxID=92902 RepID=A0AAE0TWK3_9PEZI|nr:hypothetical protein B0T24DRAFT_600388 [Lasiosphaeria ovina]
MEPANDYPLPSNREGNGARLNLQHEVFRLILNNQLLTTQLFRGFSGRALNVGTGTGIWAAEFAAENPAAHILGIDLYALSITPVPTICAFRVLDAEKDWDLPPETFDLVHARMFIFLLKGPRAVLRKCFEPLRPGDMVEF